MCTDVSGEGNRQMITLIYFMYCTQEHIIFIVFWHDFYILKCLTISSPNTPLIIIWHLWNIDQVHFYQNYMQIQASALTIHYHSLNNDGYSYVINSSQVTSNVNLKSKSSVSEAPMPPSSEKYCSLIMQIENIHHKELCLLG